MRILLLLFAALSLWAQPLTVLSYNIRHGQGMDGRLDLERTAAVIRSAAPDVVALQEVDRRTSRSGGVDQAEELARLTGMHALFSRSIDYGGGEYGNAVLSKDAALDFKVHPLPGQEPRSLLEVRFKDFLFFAAHLDVSRTETLREESARQIAALVRERGDMPAVLAGDLNTVRGRETLKALTEEWRVAGDQELPTIPSPEPRRQIDFILFRPADKWRVTEVRVIEEKVASDHRPILAVLER